MATARSWRPGQYVRYATPANPRTDRQVAVRSVLAQQARRFDTLTDDQQNAWNTAGASFRSTPTLGQSGPLTGLQLFTRINCKLGLLGQDPVDVPPTAPQFPSVAPQNLVITNTSGVIVVKLTCPADPGQNTVLRASPPQNSGVRACGNFRIIGICPTPAQGFGGHYVPVRGGVRRRASRQAPVRPGQHDGGRV